MQALQQLQHEQLQKQLAAQQLMMQQAVGFQRYLLLLSYMKKLNNVALAERADAGQEAARGVCWQSGNRVGQRHYASGAV